MPTSIPYRLTFAALLTFTATLTRGDEFEFFEKKIRPVLVTHCYKCHAADAKNIRGGLLLDSKEGLLAGGDSGPAVVSGEPDESLLLSAMRHESFEMPPDRKLPDHIIADFTTWIENGARDPRSGGTTIARQTVDIREGKNFWSFQPLQKPDVPVSANKWAQTDIDRFVDARHAANQVKPVPDASPEVVARRLYFALIGVPPDPQQIREFVAAWDLDAEVAIADVTEQLLASPHFGERWGRHWLDAVRFAESSGGGRSLLYPDAWRFRDYVIRSFNADKPFDQMIREHLAGDLLPAESDAEFDDQVTGTGYLVLGPTNYEQQDKELLRMDVIDEQIDTLGRTFLGLTIGCARCHDHKFDPIPTSDYYALAGIFRSTTTLTPGNVSGYIMTSLKSGKHAENAESWSAREKSLKADISAVRKQIRQPSLHNVKGIDVASLPGIVIDDTDASFEGQWAHSSHSAPYVGAGYRHNDYKKDGKSVRFFARLPQSGRYRVRMSHNYSANRNTRLPVHITHAEGTDVTTINQDKAPAEDGVFTDLGDFQFDAGRPAEVFINAEEAGDGVIIVDAVQFLPVAPAGNADVVDDGDQQRELKARLAVLENALKQHAKSKPEVPQAMSVRDDDSPADWHIHIRGGVRNLGPTVPRGFVSVAMTLDENGRPAQLPRIPAGSSGRLELADWVASPDNPLTARVMVNRIWLNLIGEGLVRTPDNFGATGRSPTHPALLDYLAGTFIDDHWSVKSMIRRIVASRVFRLSSEPPADASSIDPENRLLTHGFRRRLDAEALRDSMLKISGQLDLQTQGGRTIGKISQYDNGYDHNQYSRRLRSVYVPFFRNSMLESFSIFDIANPNVVTGQRTVSTLPAQALYLLNSPFVMEQSEFAAVRFLETQSADPGQVETMIHEAALLCLGRSASQEEVAVLRNHLTDRNQYDRKNWSAVFQAFFASMDFRYTD